MVSFRVVDVFLFQCKTMTCSNLRPTKPDMFEKDAVPDSDLKASFLKKTSQEYLRILDSAFCALAGSDVLLRVPLHTFFRSSLQQWVAGRAWVEAAVRNDTSGEASSTGSFLSISFMAKHKYNEVWIYLDMFCCFMISQLSLVFWRMCLDSAGCWTRFSLWWRKTFLRLLAATYPTTASEWNCYWSESAFLPEFKFTWKQIRYNITWLELDPQLGINPA